MNELSKVQSDRKKNGEKWQHKILSISSSKWENCKLRLDDLETTKTWNCDLVNHKDKIFLELTTSAKDGKESKVILESRVYKHHYPDYKFVVGIKKIPKDSIRKSDGLNSVVDHLNQTPTIDQVLIGEEEILKFMNKPFYNKKITINNKPTGVVMTSSTLLMDTILHGASMGNTDGVTKLIEMMSGNNKSKTRPSPKKKAKNYGKGAQERKRQYFLNTVVEGVKSNFTQSIAKINEDTLNVNGKQKRSLDRFFGSKLATSLKEMGVKMIDTGSEKKNPDRYHFNVSDIRSNVS
jgi:uncharacterized protein YlxP (DUF503 family)